MVTIAAMKSSKLFVVLLGLAAVSLQAQVPDTFQIIFKGTCQTTNDSGQIVSQPVNNQTLIQRAVDQTGVPNSRLSLVYKFDLTSNADVIGVAGTNGTLIYTNFVFLAPFDSVTNADQTQFVRVADLFTDESLNITDEDVGHALITERLMLNSHSGTVKKTLLTGSMIYFMTANGTNGERCCSATFNATKPLVVP